MSFKSAIISMSMMLSFFFIGILFISCSKGEREIIEYYDSENPKLIYYIKNIDGVKKRTYEKMYYENGKTRYEGKYENDLRQGIWKYYFENGLLFAKIDNKKNKIIIEIYNIKKEKLVNKNDEIKEIANYPDGSIAMIRIKKGDQEKEYTFYESYNIFEEKTLKNNFLDGIVKAYHENGQISSLNYFKQGVQDSIFVLYHDNGNIQVKGQYKDDNKIGVWKFYNSEGNEDGIEEYSKDGSIIKSRQTGVRYYDKQGNEITIK